MLYPSDHVRVTAELQRLQAKKLKSKAKQTDDEAPARWMSTHKQLAADSFLPNFKFLLVWARGLSLLERTWSRNHRVGVLTGIDLV